MGRIFKVYGREDTVVRARTFRIHIPAKSLMTYPKPVWDRFMKFVEDHRDSEMMEGTAYQDPINQGWILVGAGTSRMISILLAAARGDDLTVLLDKYEEQEREE